MTPKTDTKLADSSSTQLQRPLPFQQLKITVTWYIRHGFAIGRGRSRGSDV